MSRKRAQEIHQSLTDAGVTAEILHGDDLAIEQGGMLHGDRKAATMPVLGDIMQQKQVLIYTGTMTAGVDIQVPFRDVIGWFRHCSSDAMQWVQGLYRCRQQERMTLIVPCGDVGRAVPVQSLVADGYNSLLTDAESLQMYCRARAETMQHHALRIIAQQVASMGHQIAIEPLEKPSVEHVVAELPEQFVLQTVGQSAIEAEKKWSLTRQAVATDVNAIRSVQLLRSAGLNDQQIVAAGNHFDALGGAESAQKYIAKHADAIRRYWRFQRLGDAAQRTAADVKSRKRYGVNDTRLHVAATKDELILEAVAARAATWTGKIANDDPRLKSIGADNRTIQRAMAIKGLEMRACKVGK